MSLLNRKSKIAAAFTLIEVMLLLVVLSLVFASSTSVITRKHKLKPRRSVHGTYICYRNRDDGLLHEVMFSGKSLLYENNQTLNPAFTECHFEAPKTASYLYLQIVGGGGAGGNSNQSATSNDFSASWTGLDGSTSRATVLSFLRDNTSTGLTTDYVHSFKFGEKTLSVKWLRKFFKENKFKIALYDYAGSGAKGGSYIQNYLTKSSYERSAEDPDDVFYWYNSYCQDSSGSTTSATPEDCLKLLKAGSYYSGPSYFVSDIVSQTKLFYKDYKDALGTGIYCQQRPPLYKNCPWLFVRYFPINDSKECSGGEGGQGGLIASPVFDFDLGYSYQLGKRYAINPITGEADINKTIDWSDPVFHSSSWGDKYKGEGVGCVVRIDFGVDYGSSRPGVLLKFEEACDEEGKNCKDIEGVEISNPQQSEDGYIYSNKYNAYFEDRVSVCEQDEEGNDILETCKYEMQTKLGEYNIYEYYPRANYGSVPVDSRYFKEYPVVKIFKKYNPENCQQKGTLSYGAGRGKDGGLPYFENALGVKEGEGIKLCKDGVCTLYSQTNATLTGSNSFVAGKGGLGSHTINNMLDADLLLNPDAACPDRTTVESSGGLKGDGGTTKLDVPSAGQKSSTYGYVACSGPFMFMFTPVHGDYDLIAGSSGYSGNSSYYNCPRPKYNATNLDIGVTLSHYVSRMQLYRGEKGQAGAYKTMFARSFGDSGLVMNPGRGGVARAIDSGSSLPGGNGERTFLGTDCDENGDNCEITVSAFGGLGGRSHLGDGYQYIPLSNKDIYDIAHNVNDPELLKKIEKYSSNYEDNSYLGEDSGFQQVSFLSDLSMLQDGDTQVVNLIGKGGNGGWVKHNCFLRPQYFAYHYYGYGYRSDPSSSINDSTILPNIDGDEYTPAGVEFDEWEGYTNSNAAVIQSLAVCSKDGKSPENQFEETQATNGFPGAIVIMW